MSSPEPSYHQRSTPSLQEVQSSKLPMMQNRSSKHSSPHKTEDLPCSRLSRTMNRPNEENVAA